MPQDAYARGELFIGSKENSYTVLPGLPPSIQGYHWQFGITIVTPDRKFLCACETLADQQDWIAVFQKVVHRPMLPQEYAGKRISRFPRRSLFQERRKEEQRENQSTFIVTSTCACVTESKILFHKDHSAT